MQQARLPSLFEISTLAFMLIGVIFLFVHVLEVAIQLSLLVCWFVGLLVCWLLVMGLGKILGLNYNKMQQGLITGIGHGMKAVLFLIAVGALIGSWMAGGIVPNIIYLTPTQIGTK